jgi:hypothetical protein
MAFVYWCADGGGRGVGGVHNTFVRWIRAQGPAPFIVNGGDVYDDGTGEEYGKFFEQMDRQVADLCETPGNHDWRTRSESAATGVIPAQYEAFWSRFPPPLSRQPIDTAKKSGARYEHFIDVGDWRLVFLDTGFCEDNPWPMGDPGRLTWLRQALTGRPGRAKIVFAHHSRLSFGKHGDVEDVGALWEACFDNGGAPLAALTIAGHDHNVSLYGPRPKAQPKTGPVAPANGIFVMVNGAGGRGHDRGVFGTRPDLHFDDDNYCVTRLNLIDARSADVDVFSFGPSKNPDPQAPPSLAKSLQIRF